MMEDLPIDFGIVTALQVERDAVLGRLENYESLKPEDEPLPLYRGRINLPNQRGSYNVIVCLLLSIGTTDAGVAATKVLERYNPAKLLLVGVQL
jgi:nucleoside phosphorylase